MDATRIIALLGFIAALGLTGCVSIHPELDRHLGDALAATKSAQVLNPRGAAEPSGAAGVDGRAAKETMDRYVDSFKAPPPTTNVINIGGSLATGR